MQLTDLLNKMSVRQVVGAPENIEVAGITLDSREVKKNFLFTAIKGYKTDGHKFIPEAIAKQPAAIVLSDSESAPDEMFIHSNCVKIVVDDSRRALAEISNIFYSQPSKELKLIGITGTKGKTTTTFFVKHLLQTAGYKSGLLGTIANYVGEEEIDTKLTTQESPNLNKLMRRMVDNNCTHCVMEVSSHSLSLKRVAYLDFDIALFTNITSDHFDFHKDFDSYLSAKKILFDDLKPDGIAIYNIDDPNSDGVIQDLKAKRSSFGRDKNADLCISNVDYTLNGTSFTVTFSGKEYIFKTQLIGSFNAYNAAASIAVGQSLKIDFDTMQNAIETTPQVPGRFEVLSSIDKKVIVDYSHTTDSLRQALQTIRQLTNGKLPVHTVFGCGGDRDKTKRPEMGQVADELSNEIYITSDNPRTEDPYKIIDDIKKGVKRKAYHVIENREEAIRKAICDSEPNAVILVAGKGHENYQEINGVRNYFSDKETAEKYLKKCSD